MTPRECLAGYKESVMNWARRWLSRQKARRRCRGQALVGLGDRDRRLACDPLRQKRPIHRKNNEFELTEYRRQIHTGQR